jgi:hypothetical protein
MGLKIESIDESEPVPRAVRVIIECDVATEMFCRGFITSEANEGYMTFFSRAVRCGWTERRTTGERVFACPECK